MFKKVSCCPANEASGRSSAVAEERTAKLLPSIEIFSHSTLISATNFLDKGAFETMPRNFFPALLR